VIQNGINALELIESEEVRPETFSKAISILKGNYGADYSHEKALLLLEMIREEGWTEERFMRTFKWFLKNKPFPAWTIADWFQYGVRLYPLEWANQQAHEFGSGVWDRMDIYEVESTDGKKVLLFKWKDGEDVPLKKYEPKPKGNEVFA